ncbi:hypothetical protein TNCV_343961 [Trichonephila clavipes]|nr:hypothetical protein TNCV_343961 [Trichonephila clavipes]
MGNMRRVHILFSIFVRSWQGSSSTPIISRSFEHHAGDSTIRIGSAPNFEAEPLQGWSAAFHLSSSYTSLTKEFAARRKFRFSLYCKDIKYLQTSMPSPGFEHRSYNTGVSVTNHYTGWVAVYCVYLKTKLLLDLLL